MRCELVERDGIRKIQCSDNGAGCFTPSVRDRGFNEPRQGNELGRLCPGVRKAGRESGNIGRPRAGQPA